MSTLHYRDPVPEPGRWRAIGLAIGMHALLIGLLAIGVAWKSSEPETVEAELWSSVPQVAAPAPPRPAPAPTPEPPKPQPAPQPQAAQPQPEAPKPDIALERERQRKRDEQQRLEDEQRKLAQERKRADEQRREEQKKLEAKKQQEAERQRLAKADAERAEKADADAQRKREQADRAAQKKIADERFNKNLAALSAQASNTPSTGTAAVTSGPKGDPSYGSRIQTLVRGNTFYSDPSASLPRAEYAVELDPAGYVLNLRKLKSSGSAGWDEAVERAIKKSEPFPPDKSGRPPSSLTITHCPSC